MGRTLMTHLTIALGLVHEPNCGVRSPLKEVGLTKQEIRQLSSSLHLKSSEKPAFACLASRFPYGVKITKERLKQVEAC